MVTSQPQNEGDAQRLELSSRHVSFWLRHLRLLPAQYTSADTQRMTIAFFCLSALDLLGALQSKTSDEDRRSYRDWIYRMQCPGGGFSGSPASGSASTSTSTSRGEGDYGHLAMTYTALANLAILRDDFTRLDRRALRNLLKTCQRSDGSFSSTPGAQEYDPRFTYCAFAVCSMLGDWTSIDVELALRYLDCCQVSQFPLQHSRLVGRAH